ncbi:MAG: hypothetical protein ACP5XB_27815 [Isosphaeraceae bacterium]
MALKSFHDIATSLSGSAFRRACFDGRTQMLRAIPTWGSRSGNTPRPCLPVRPRDKKAR